MWQAVLAIYFQVMQWLPLGRWNYQPGFTPLGVEAIHGRASPRDVLLLAAFVLPFAAFWLAYSKGWRWLMWICATCAAGRSAASRAHVFGFSLRSS